MKDGEEGWETVGVALTFYDFISKTIKEGHKPIMPCVLYLVNIFSFMPSSSRNSIE